MARLSYFPTTKARSQFSELSLHCTHEQNGRPFPRNVIPDAEVLQIFPEHKSFSDT